MKGYIISHYDVTDKETYEPPVKSAAAVIEQYGGTFIVASPKGEALDGTPSLVNIVIEFESLDAAQQFYDSLEYAPHKERRLASTEGWTVVISGYETPA